MCQLLRWHFDGLSNADTHWLCSAVALNTRPMMQIFGPLSWQMMRWTPSHSIRTTWLSCRQCRESFQERAALLLPLPVARQHCFSSRTWFPFMFTDFGIDML